MSPVDKSALVNWITKRLKKTKRTKVGLAQALGLKGSQVTRILKGERRIAAIELPIIERYLGEMAPAQFRSSMPTIEFAGGDRIRAGELSRALADHGRSCLETGHFDETKVKLVFDAALFLGRISSGPTPAKKTIKRRSQQSRAHA